MVRVWPQSYYVLGKGLGFSALVAFLPTLLLVYLLAVRRKPSWIAAVSGLGATFLIATFAYGMSFGHAISSTALGASFGIFPITWIIFWALVLYEITVVTGKMDVIKHSIGSITSDRRIQAIIIAFAFGGFLEGAAGFGTPVVVAAAIMVGLGFAPLYATSMCLLADTAPVVFGSIGIPVITLAGISGLPVGPITAVAGRLVAPFALLLPAYMILVTSGAMAMFEVWPAILVAGTVFSGIQLYISNYIGPELADILSSVGTMGALVILLRFWKPRHIEPVEGETGKRSRSMLEECSKKKCCVRSSARYSSLQIWSAWMPYTLLVICVLAWGYQPFATQLNKASYSFAWPDLHNQILRMPPVSATPAKYAAKFNFNWLSASGTSAMLASLLASAFAGVGPRSFIRIILSVSHRLIRPTVTIASMLAMAYLMNYCGATGTLGLAFAATGHAFPFFSPIMGWLGVFLTGSDTSSNALFGNLQVISANRLGLDPILIAAANSVGGVMGKMISLQTIAVAAAATGMSVSDQSKLFRLTLRHSIFLASLVGAEVLICAYAIR